jgi:hypothetical protein
MVAENNDAKYEWRLSLERFWLAVLLR